MSDVTDPRPELGLWSRERAGVHEKLREHERRITTLEEDDGHDRLWQVLDGVRLEVAAFRGEVKGAVRTGIIAGGVVGSLLAILVQVLFQAAQKGSP